MAQDPSAESDKIYIALGKALSQWSMVEDSLCTAFCLATGNPTTFPNAHAFWAVVSFDAKLSMTHSVLTAKFLYQKEILALWQAAYNKLPRKNQKRNKLAHGTVMSFKLKGKAPNTKTYLCPYYMSALRKLTVDEVLSSGDPRPKERLSAADIDEITRGFKRTDETVRRVCGAMYRELNAPKPGERPA